MFSQWLSVSIFLLINVIFLCDCYLLLALPKRLLRFSRWYTEGTEESQRITEKINKNKFSV